MSAFAKLLDLKPEVALAYHIGTNEQQRINWMHLARESEFPENRARCVKRARVCNRALVRALHALRNADGRQFQSAVLYAA